ncbi:MAG: 50S ribosomal protein L1 [Spirochaetes bacterium GWF1_31_7]|nr:MAG: 50S ribosomal protein L1 [Spirochaetes bacterium GWE1_32_154]OHD47329.1 MAG: 50S ribosomal protein L1 [Spirochaetes bacterium GWE2_31_10]OHD53192.1 MAG: 50S ribosomal protein L1 [Spirochaetes bacterium GWF1_31_7]OHD78375.1 MAG: 50S ribosomal protein L1 [Spirochaetes bacterium RIFOXYB1_FULL_32_8]HBD95003.1 50S ribosomal protein L1 [Spirochaetia bacterium]
MKRGKKYLEVLKKYNPQEELDVVKALDLVKELKYAKFDETVEVSINLNLKKSHTVRDTVVLPNSFGAEKKILVFTKADKEKEAIDAGAAFAGGDELIEKVKAGWTDFDVVVATPDMMKEVGKLGPILGRKGLMPNPKTGTVTNDVKGAVSELKKGRIEFRANKEGILNMGIGKSSMPSSKVYENIKALFDEVLRKKPSDLKGDYVASVYVSSTMSPSVKINHKAI